MFVVRVIVVTRCGFRCRDNRLLKGECHRRCDHHNGSATTQPRPRTRVQLHTSNQLTKQGPPYTKLNAENSLFLCLPDPGKAILGGDHASICVAVVALTGAGGGLLTANQVNVRSYPIRNLVYCAKQ